MGRIIAIDYGKKRIGLAVTDPLKIIANSLVTVEEKEAIKFLKDYILREEVETIVVGKPMRFDGSDTHSTQDAAKFVNLLKLAFPQIKIVEVDERFTSLMAKRTLVEMGLKKKDNKRKRIWIRLVRR